MKVILQKDIKNLGQAGDIVNVKKGYARHLLLPKKLAAFFTEGSHEQVKHRQNFIESQKKKALGVRQALIKKLKDTQLTFVREADNKGHLFGSVTSFEVSKELQNQGYEIDKKVIKLEQALKKVGDYSIVLDFGMDIKAEIKVQISAKNVQKENLFAVSEDLDQDHHLDSE